MRIAFRILIVLLLIWSLMDYAAIENLERDVAALKWRLIQLPDHQADEESTPRSE